MAGIGIGIGIEMEADDETPKIPEEIIIDILIRLPTQSFLNFRFVSKSWYSIISSPSVAQSHLRAFAATTTFGKDSIFINHRLMLTVGTPSGTPRSSLKHVSLPSLIEEPSSSISSIDANIQDYTDIESPPSSYVSVIGAHSGLVCICIDKWDLFLWNPATGVHARLPSAPRGLDDDDDDGFGGLYVAYGFGYSDATQDYKVFAVIAKNLSFRNYEFDAKMYSRKANSWNTIEGGYEFGIPRRSGTFLNGKLHFSVFSVVRIAIKYEIVSVDLDSQTCRVMELPDYGKGETFGAPLGVLGGCICVLSCSNHLSTQSAYLWVLKEYGIKESWTRLARINVMDDEVGVQEIVELKPLIMLPNGEILLVYCQRLAIYSPGDDVWTYPEIRDLPSIIDANVYVESLISPQVN